MHAHSHARARAHTHTHTHSHTRSHARTRTRTHHMGVHFKRVQFVVEEGLLSGARPRQVVFSSIPHRGAGRWWADAHILLHA